MIKLVTYVYDHLERFTGVVVRALVWGPAKIQRRRHRRAPT
jgi:hypothetical protein